MHGILKEAPSWAGDWVMAASIINGREKIGRHRQEKVEVLPNPKANIARFEISPDEVNTGDQVKYKITLKNSGEETWGPVDIEVHVRVGNPPDDASRSDGQRLEIKEKLTLIVKKGGSVVVKKPVNVPRNKAIGQSL